MARPSGSRDKQFDERRSALIALARGHLSSPEGRNASWRDLATASGVSTSTLTHYFGDRQALVSAILEHAREEGEFYLVMAARPAEDFAGSVCGGRAARGQQRQEHEDRDRDQILEKEDAGAHVALGRAHLTAVGEQLQHNHGGG